MEVIKYRDKSLTLEGLNATMSRLEEYHPLQPTLSARRSNIEAGIAGEKRVEEVLSRYSFSIKHNVFHDLTLSANHQRFQMDTFSLTPFYGIIFETKNIGGKLKFQHNPPQLIRTRDDGQQDGFDCPAAQAEWNRKQLLDWLKTKNINIPIYCVVVLAYPKQIVEQAPQKTRILFPKLIPSYINQIPLNSAQLDPLAFTSLSSELKNSHIPYIPDPICDIYRIPHQDIRTGVRCDSCGVFGMKKTLKGWICRCGSVSKNAHHQTIKDWFLLFGRKMTNKDCRELLHVNVRTATRILQGMNLQAEGEYRYRTYSMNLYEQ